MTAPVVLFACVHNGGRSLAESPCPALRERGP